MMRPSSTLLRALYYLSILYNIILIIYYSQFLQFNHLLVLADSSYSAHWKLSDHVICNLKILETVFILLVSSGWYFVEVTLVRMLELSDLSVLLLKYSNN